MHKQPCPVPATSVSPASPRPPGPFCGASSSDRETVTVAIITLYLPVRSLRCRQAHARGPLLLIRSKLAPFRY